jgi:hypothetical protein
MKTKAFSPDVIIQVSSCKKQYEIMVNPFACPEVGHWGFLLAEILRHIGSAVSEAVAGQLTEADVIDEVKFYLDEHLKTVTAPVDGAMTMLPTLLHTTN